MVHGQFEEHSFCDYQCAHCETGERGGHAFLGSHRGDLQACVPCMVRQLWIFLLHRDLPSPAFAALRPAALGQKL